jgi:hypothetical protein
VLECISKLEEMINLGTGQMRDKDFFAASSNKNIQSLNKTLAAQKSEREATIQANCEMVVQNITMT